MPTCHWRRLLPVPQDEQKKPRSSTTRRKSGTTRSTGKHENEGGGERRRTEAENEASSQRGCLQEGACQRGRFTVWEWLGLLVP